MPTLQFYRDTYSELSGIASDVSRKLGFAGIAIIWIFTVESADKSYVVPQALYSAGLAIISSLALDLMQYVFGALIWGVFWRVKEWSGVKDSQNIDAPAFFNWPALTCFWVKLLLMFSAYWYLLSFLFSHIARG